MPKPDFNAAISYALSRLENELSPKFLYHSSTHTRDDVLRAARKFAKLSHLTAAEFHILEVGAVFHDIGFLFLTNGHEQRGAELAQEVLPGFGFSPAQIEQTANMILATRLPQSPSNLLEELLADADLDVLGRKDFMERNELLRQEIALSGKIFSDEEWYAQQLKFLESHTYFSEAARRVRGGGKKKNMILLRRKLQTATSAL
jgi:predicted metal-dependent HD superfamily phosphohydrolase